MDFFRVVNIDREIERQRDLEFCGPYHETRDYDDIYSMEGEYEEAMELIERDRKLREEENNKAKLDEKDKSPVLDDDDLPF